MRGRRIALLAGLVTLGTVVLVVVLQWGWFLERWYVWRLNSEDEGVRHAALQGLAEVGTLRSVPALLEVLRTDVDEMAFTKGTESEEWWCVPEVTEKERERYPDQERCKRLNHDGYGEARTLLTPAAFALYRAGNDEVPALREPWRETERVAYALRAIRDAYSLIDGQVLQLAQSEVMHLLSRMERQKVRVRIPPGGRPRRSRFE